ncbi:hypothetical protein STEG23_037173, partial [Scotinomys teguina]
MAAGTPHKDGVKARRCAPPPAGKKSRGPHKRRPRFPGAGPLKRPPGAPCRARGQEAAPRRSPPVLRSVCRTAEVQKRPEKVIAVLRQGLERQVDHRS